MKVLYCVLWFVCKFCFVKYCLKFYVDLLECLLGFFDCVVICELECYVLVIWYNSNKWCNFEKMNVDLYLMEEYGERKVWVIFLMMKSEVVYNVSYYFRLFWGFYGIGWCVERFVGIKYEIFMNVMYVFGIVL